MWFSNRNTPEQRRSATEDAAPPAAAVGEDGQDRGVPETKGISQLRNEDVTRRSVVRYAQPVPKLQKKLEISTDDEKDSSSSKMWQVYALAAFMVGRWVWARVKERRARSDDEE